MYCFRLCNNSKDFSLILMSSILHKFLILWALFAGRFVSADSFASYSYTTVRKWYNHPMLQPSVTVTLRMHNVVFSSISAPQTKAVTKINA